MRVVARLTQGVCVALSALVGFALATGMAPALFAVGLLLACCGLFVSLGASLRRPSTRRLGVALAVGLATLWLAAAWFSGPMHDVALALFDHHGRFGCTHLDGQGRSAYWLRDWVFAALLFTPIVVVTAGAVVRARSGSG